VIETEPAVGVPDETVALPPVIEAPVPLPVDAAGTVRASVVPSVPAIVVTLESEPVTSAEPLKLWPHKVLVVVNVAAEPVVFPDIVESRNATVLRVVLGEK
jgi:hypothetical protein